MRADEWSVAKYERAVVLAQVNNVPVCIDQPFAHQWVVNHSLNQCENSVFKSHAQLPFCEE